jgi:transketolase
MDIRVIGLYCVKPLDGKALAARVKATPAKFITDEDHFEEGGIGAAVLAVMAVAGQHATNSKRLAVRGMPHSGKPDQLLDAFGISAKHIVSALRELS